MKRDDTINAFFALLRAGLWEKEACLSSYISVNYDKVLLLSQEQCVEGIIAAGIEYVKDVKLPQEFVLQIAGLALQNEQRNIAMNGFIRGLVEIMHEYGIFTLLVKGQGIAQCYERPLWRTSGDVDFLLSEDNYNQAKTLLLPLSVNYKSERNYSREIGMYIDQWLVELHGSLRTGLSTRVDREIDNVQREVFNGGSVRSWINGKTQIPLPGVNNDVFFVFTHFLKHFFKDEGVCIRQLCDWCRLMWYYRGQIDDKKLTKRLENAGLISEWKAFASLAVDYLGMPEKEMLLYSPNILKLKSDKIIDIILRGKSKGRFYAFLSNIGIFPLNTFRFFMGILFEANMLKLKERYWNVSK